MSGPHVVFRTSGTYDAGSDVTIGPDGSFRAEDGGYVTRGPRDGHLSPAERTELARLVADLGPPTVVEATEADGFASELTVDGRRYAWPNRPPTPALAVLVRFLSSR